MKENYTSLLYSCNGKIDDNKYIENFNNNNINVCLLIPGFIKSYKFLDEIKRKLNNLDGINFYIFGYIFSYMIEPSINKDKISYNQDTYKDLNIDKVNNFFTKFSFIDNNLYKKYDDEGYDNRIYSQWNNFKKSYELYLNFSNKNNFNADVFIKFRSDLNFDENLLYKYIKYSYDTNKCIFFEKSCSVIHDTLMIIYKDFIYKIANLCDNFSNYYLLPEIKNKMELHKNDMNKPKFNDKLRFPCQSEYLLWLHVNKVLDKNSYRIYNNFFNIMRDDSSSII
jgi:hypothetical protein